MPKAAAKIAKHAKTKPLLLSLASALAAITEPKSKSREPIALSEVPAVALSEAVLDLGDVLGEQD